MKEAFAMTDRPRLLDLYCGEGGAARGYMDAGFTVLGVDNQARCSRYYARAVYLPDGVVQFVRDIGDWEERQFIEFVTHFGFKAIHASTPCQLFTELNSKRERHVNLIPHTRRLLQATGLPYVLENVRAAREHLIDPVSLDGLMFDNYVYTSQGQRFNLSRERLFEANWPLEAPTVTPSGFGAPEFPLANVYGGHIRARATPWRTGKGTGRTIDFPGEDRAAMARQLMGMPWATMQGMSEAVPPSYTKWIGQKLLEHIAQEEEEEES